MISVLVTFLVVTQNSPSHGQQSGKRSSAPPPKSESEANSDASSLMGQYGYKIQIPEMTMKRVINSNKSKPPAPAHEQSSAVESTQVPGKIVREEEASVQPVETPKPPEAQKSLEPVVAPVNMTKLKKEPEPLFWAFDYIEDYNFLKLPGRYEFSGIFFLSVILVLVAAAGGPTKDGYVVIRDKKGVCRIIKSRTKTPSTIAGPFRTKEIAKKVMKKVSLDASPALISTPKHGCVQLRLPIRCCKIVPSSQPTMSKGTLTGGPDLVANSTFKMETGSLQHRRIN